MVAVNVELAQAAKVYEKDAGNLFAVKMLQTPLAVLLINEKWTYIPKKSLMRLDKTMDKTDF